MLTRIEVAQKSPGTDAKANKVLAAIHEDLKLPVDKVAAIAVYVLEMELSAEEKTRIAQELFADPITENVAIDSALANDFDYLVEAGFKPGVTDNVGQSSREGIEDLLGRKLTDEDKVFAQRQFLFWGNLNTTQIETIATRLLANALIERVSIISREEWKNGKRLSATSNRVLIPHQPVVNEVQLPTTDAELVALSDAKILALTAEEMQAIRAYYAETENASRRVKAGLPAHPTDVELEVIAQTWSEHCKHKIFSADVEYKNENGEIEKIHSLFKTYVQAATKAVRPFTPWLKSVFTDNAGVIALNDEWDISIKVETHNSPSALDPYGGAMTGIVGVNRDILGCGMGCKPIFNTDVFCFASPFYDKPVPEKLHHPRRLLKEVHRGVRDGGNESGIPTVNGSIVFDDRFLGKPLVFCGTGGLIPAILHGKPSWQKSIEPGDRIVMAGGRIGKDGIHGATFSSAALTEASPTSAVQIGDPITQKKMADFMLEARDLGYYRFVTDNGAGGLSSSLGEMAKECGGGQIHLDKAPLKYAGLDPWEILVSEAQERMSFAVPPENLSAFEELAKRRGVEVTDLGVFTNSGLFEAFFKGKLVCQLDMEFLHEGNPTLQIQARYFLPKHQEPPAQFIAGRDLKADALNLLSALNICSKESWVRQYDHEVQAMSVIKPFVGEKADGPSDAAVIRPLYNRKEGVAVGHGLAPRYSDIDCYAMTACAIDEAMRNVIAVGAKPGEISGLDNFCWPDPVESDHTPDGQIKMGHLVRSNKALYDYCVAYKLPLVSGKDSMKNDYGRGKDKISVPPTLLFTVMARLDDVEKTITMDAKAAGDLVYALGKTYNELGASEYYHALGFIGNDVPQVNATEAWKLYEGLHQAIHSGLVRSAHDCSDGGLFVSLAEVAMAGRLGLRIDLDQVPSESGLLSHQLLFSESQSRFVITVTPENKTAFEKIMANLPCALIGSVQEKPELDLRRQGAPLFQLSLEEMFSSWHKPLNW